MLLFSSDGLVALLLAAAMICSSRVELENAATSQCTSKTS